MNYREVTLAATGNNWGPHETHHTFLEIETGDITNGNTDEPEVHLLIRSNDGEFAQGWFLLSEIRKALEDE